MKITFKGAFTLTDEQKSKLEDLISQACADNGYNYSAEIRLFTKEDMITISVYPPETSHYVSFHLFDLKRMGKILGMDFKFCDLFNGRLELSFMK